MLIYTTITQLHSTKTLIQLKGATISHVIFTFLGLKTYRFLDTKVLQERADQSKYNWVTVVFSPYLLLSNTQLIFRLPIRIFTAMLIFPLEDLIKIYVLHLLDSNLERFTPPPPRPVFWSSMTLIDLKSLGPLFCTLLPIWICLVVPSLIDSG